MKFVGILIMALFSFSCASPNTVGVRPEFETSRVKTIAMMPTYSVGGFGMTAREREIVERMYEFETIYWLEAQGFEVVRPDELQAAVQDRESQELYDEVVELDHSLNRYFEDAPPQAESIERTSLRELWTRKALPTRAILFTEVVYQTDGTCRTAASEHTEYSEVVGPAESDQPCIISHFQAKLVDAESGVTMWHNRMLRELRGDLTPLHRAENIGAVVETTFAGPYGITPFIRETGSPGAKSQTAASLLKP